MPMDMEAATQAVKNSGTIRSKVSVFKKYTLAMSPSNDTTPQGMTAPPTAHRLTL